MTSKEALEHIVNNDYNQIICTIPAQEAYNGLTREEMIKIVEKDLDKLDQYETIEEELGIDLITLFKALKNGIYFENDKQHHIVELNLGISGDYRLSYEIIDGLHENVYVKDYGKTWALTKEELENEQRV